MKSHLNSVRRKTVLVAEDDDAITQVIVAALEGEGFSIQRVADGIAAINTILETRPDVILLDLMLPELDGYNICKMVRKADAVHHTPILVISGRTTVEDRLRAFEVGADDYVTKPFDLEELLARVEALLLRSRPGGRPTPFLAEDWE